MNEYIDAVDLSPSVRRSEVCLVLVARKQALNSSSGLFLSVKPARPLSANEKVEQQVGVLELLRPSSQLVLYWETSGPSRPWALLEMRPETDLS